MRQSAAIFITALCQKRWECKEMKKKKTTRDLFAFFLCVSLVFSNMTYLMDAIAYTESSASAETVSEYIQKAELFEGGNTNELSLQRNEEDAVTAVFPDKATSLQVRVHATDTGKATKYFAQLWYFDTEQSKWITEGMWNMPIVSAKFSYANLTFIGARAKYVAVGKKHRFKLQLNTAKTNGETKETYYFNLIRSVALSQVTATNSDHQPMPVNEQEDNKYVISCPYDSLHLTCTVKTPAFAKIRIDNEEIANGEETIIDLTKYAENSSGQREIPILVRYTGEDGTGTDTAYTVFVNKIDYTPQVTTKYVGATPENKDTEFAETKKYISCSKDTEIKMEAEASAPEGSVLSYQWYIQPREGGSVAKKIDNATESSYTIPTQHSARNIYYCEVTNTVSGIVLTARTEKCDIEVKPTYASPAEILSQTESAEVFFGQAGYRIKIQAKTPDRGGILKYQWYQTSQAETTGGKLVASEENYVTVDTSTVGESYYYCKVSNLLKKEDGSFSESQPTVSRPIRVNVVNAEQYFEGTGTKAEPFLIKSADELKKIREIVAKGNSFANVYFKMQPTNEERSITLPADWQPIGSLKSGFTDTSLGVGVFPFSGNLDGNGCKLIIQENGAPLFRYVREASVSNLQIFGSRINGAGLVDEYFVDYGEDGDYSTGVPNTITVDKVTLLSGSATKSSGFIHGNASGKNNIYITNSVVEKNVIIGYDGKESQIGSFAGCLNGSIISCKSAAKVNGVSQVGGIAGEKGQSMGDCSVLNCQFTGEVHATGNYAGGILGSGYDGKGTAPNTPVVTIRNCVVRGSVEGKSNVGGILGGEPGCENCWGNGAGSVVDNLFCGTVKGKDENAVVGAIVGFLKSYNENQSVASNYFIDTCGAKNGIGAVEIQHDTNFDISKTGSSVSDADVKSDTMLGRLNASSSSYKNWVKGEDGYPDHSEAPVLYAIELSGNYKTMYNTGDAFSTANMVITGKLSDGTTQNISLNDPKLKFTGFDSNKRAVQTITVTYGVAKATYDVTVLYKESQVKEIVAYFTLLGDSYHKEATADGGPHTLSKGNLQTWVSQTKVKINNNTTVYDVFKKVLKENGITWKESNKLGTVYIESLTRNGVTLGEFDNGNLSGWMYTLNGTHPNLGVAQQFLENGDRIVFHYTDDYTKEEGSDKWGAPGADEVKNVTTSGAAGSATTTAPTEVKVSGSTATATVKAENQSEILKQATENKSAEIVLEVAASDTKGAENVQLQLETSFVKNISDKTNASLTLDTANGRVSFDQKALKAIIGEAKGSTIVIEIAKVTKPTEAQQKAAGTNGDIFRLLVKSGDKIISEFNKGKATVRVEIPAKLADKKVAAIHIADDAKIEQLAGKVLTIGGKKYYEFTTPHFSSFALVDAEELGLEVEEPQVDAKALTAKLTPVARSAKTAKKNVKVTVSLDKQDKAIIKELKDAGYTVKYRFYRSTKKAAGYKAAVTKKTAVYTNTGGKKGTKYYYKVQVRVYDADGKLAAKTALKQCKYASRTWAKGK